MLQQEGVTVQGQKKNAEEFHCLHTFDVLAAWVSGSGEPT